MEWAQKPIYINSDCTGIIVDCWELTVEGGVEQLNDGWVLTVDSILRPISERGVDISVEAWTMLITDEKLAVAEAINIRRLGLYIRK